MSHSTRRHGWPGRARIALAVVCLLALTTPATAATFYVRAGGNDAQDGRRAATAFASIGRAASKMTGGDTVIVGPGTYLEGDIIPLGNGRRGELVRFFADRTGSRTGDPPGDVLVDVSGCPTCSVGFRISARPYVVINGFSVANAPEEGIAIKSRSDNSIVANCVVLSNRGRGIWVRDSARVIAFNNLVYANGLTGIDFGGENQGSPDGTALNNTVFQNGLDGIRIEGLAASPRATVLQNVIAQNFGRGINVKEKSAAGFVGQWNLNIDGYGSEATKSAFDFAGAPLLVAPSGLDLELGIPFQSDDDFRLRQIDAGQPEQSSAVDGSPLTSRWLQLASSSTHTGGNADTGKADLGFHYGNERDFLAGGGPKTRVRALRKRGSKCQRFGDGQSSCALGNLNRVRRLCGLLAEELCS